MKKLFPKSRKGAKIHSSPAEDPVRAAFGLLPAAILVLVAGLGPEDREVLAYLVALPAELGKEAAAAVPPAEQPARGGGGRSGRRGRAGGAAPPGAWVADHPPTHGCGCFDCYVSFWARWDRSPERDRILDALSAYEEHLAAAESSAPTPPSSSRRKGRRSRLPAAATPPPPMPLRRPKSSVPQDVEAPASLLLVPSCVPPPFEAPAAASTAEQDEVEKKAEPEECLEAEDEERKRAGWGNVMGGVLGLRLRLWGIWNPAVESAT